MLSTEPAASVSSILAAVGHTPLLRLGRLCRGSDLTLLAKAEFLNPGGSIHIRTALAIVREARREGRLPPGAAIVEVSAGDEGVALAMLGAILDFRTIIVMPEDAPAGRRLSIEAYGGDVRLVPVGATPGDTRRRCRDEALALAEAQPPPCLATPLEGPLHSAVHEATTGAELLAQLPLHQVDAFVASVGTGGTVTGVARALRRRFPHVRIVAVRPEGTPPLAGQDAQGAALSALDPSLISAEVAVAGSDSRAMAARLAREEGLLVGHVSGANVFAAIEVAGSLGGRATVATVLADSAAQGPLPHPSR